MTRIGNSQLWVHDQEVALAFWTKQVGWEVREDVSLPEMGFRWLVVAPPGQEDVGVVLMAVPGPPVLDEETRREVLAFTARGYAGTLFLVTEDCRAAYEELAGRGVEFSEKPEERPYGVDASFRDPSGNSVRLTELRPIG